MADIDWIKVVKNREDELNDLYTRMDTDRSLYYIDEYELKDSLSKNIPEVYSMTLPDARIYADKIIGDIKSADIQVEIEGKELKDTDASDIERFLDDYMALADEYMSNLGVGGGLKGSQPGQVSIRGWTYTKSFPYMDKGIFRPGLMQWDAKFAAYESGLDGLNWASYRTMRSKDKINADYPDIDFKGSEAEILDIITTDTNFIYINGKQARAFPHNFGFCPVVVEFNPISAYLRDEGYMEHEGESIYSAVRDLYEHLFRLISVLESQTMRSFQHNYQLLTESDQPDANMDPNPFQERSILAMRKGERLEALTPSELKQSIIYHLNLIETRLQRGTLPATDYGNISDPMSAVAIKTLGEQRNSRYQPIMDTIARSRQRLYKMIIDQWVIGGFQHEDITAPKNNILESKFKINVKLNFISPVENIANYTVADEASKYYCREDVLANHIHDPNPAETMMKKRIEEAEMLSPQLKLYRTAKALIDQGEELEAAMIAGQMGMSVAEIKGGNADENKVYQGLQQPGQGGGMAALPKLFGQGRAAPGAKSSYQESAEMSQNQEVS